MRFRRNKKVRNATPCQVDDIKFKSKLEMFTYKALKQANLKAEYEGTTFSLIPKFEYNGEKVRECTLTPDFPGDGWIIECKGFPNETFPIKWKMLKYKLLKEQSNIKLYLCKNQREILEAIEQLKKLNVNN